MAVDKFSALFDSLLTRFSSQRTSVLSSKVLLTRLVFTPVGNVRVYDSGTATTKPCVIFVPDGPNVIEHYEALIALLSPHLRVVCFDMPGFGHSLPQASYTHSLDQGAQAVLGVMDALSIDKATLAFSCANGFYAIRAALKAPQRVSQLVLSQTPSLQDMHTWVERIIPKPLKVPVFGQLVAWLFRRRTALPWYRAALPRTTDAVPFQDKARYALACGSCFCLAGVVQGLLGEAPESLRGVSTPCTVIWGTMDRSHKPTKPQSLLAYLPHANVVYFDDCGHFPDIEQPERYAAHLLQLLL
jgi:pimeloyl-ACP methyl ester carboxylesterase